MRLAAVLAVTVALTGCGSGDDGTGGGGGGGGDGVSGEEPIQLGTEAELPKRETKPQEPRREPAAVDRPDIVNKPIPFPAKRKQEMAAYAQRHYGIDRFELREPKVIVEHVTAGTTFDSAFNTFAPDVPDQELGELPGTCSHYIIDTDGTIYQLVPLDIMCRHTVGLNYTSIGIEHVGLTDADVLGNERQLDASLELTNWLRCTNGIEFRNVIGHNENRESPFHRENVPELRTQTHGDMTRASMDGYRAKLRQLSC
jgi:beta-N-acetylhexosaminidase